jgi:glycosyltransferase involved in cell wall biosynthesis
MTANPRVSIIIATLNCAETIGRTLASVSELSFSDWEVLVLDSCSTDDTAETVEALDDPRVTLHIESDEGVAQAWDRGLQRAAGKYVLFLCAGDGYRDPTWLQRCVAVMDEDREVSLVRGVPSYSREADHSDVLVVRPWHVYLDGSSGSVLGRRQKTDWFWYWLRTGCGFPDGNMCVRKDLILHCMPRYRLGARVADNLWPFCYNFNSRGFLAHGIGVVATFASIADGRLSVTRQDHCRRVRRYRAQLLGDQAQHIFRDGAGHALGAVPPLQGRIALEDLLVRTADGKLVDGIELLASTC